MLWTRAVIFSLLVPGLLAGYVPWLIGPTTLAPGLWKAGWILVAAGALIYLRHLWGEEPQSLVRTGIYRYSCKPMYLAVISVIFGQAFAQYCRTVPRWL